VAVAVAALEQTVAVAQVVSVAAETVAAVQPLAPMALRTLVVAAVAARLEAEQM
jgi:hypothetical protein